MSELIMLPLWLVLLLSVSAVISLWHHVLRPLIAGLLLTRERRLNQRLSSELSRKLPEVFRVKRSARIELFINSPAVQAAMAEIEEQGGGTRELLDARAREYANEMIPGFYALFYFKVGYALARTYIRIMYQLHVARQPSKATYGIPENASVVLVGNHRSNMDVVLLAYLAARTNMVSFAAGEWARPWPWCSIMHMCGSYVIRRKADDLLYRRMLAIHLREMVKAKMPQGIFLEGGLTRDGRVQPLKLGLLNYILSCLGDANVADIVFVPVAFNYDQVPEDHSLINSGNKSYRGRSRFYTVFATLFSLLRLWYIRYKRGDAAYGHAAVSFGEPLSMNSWLAEQGLTADSLDAEQRHEIVEPVAQELEAQIKAIIPVLPVSLVASVFAEDQDAVLSELEIISRAAALMERLKVSEALLPLSEGENSQALIEGIHRLQIRQVLYEQDGIYRLNKDNLPLLHYLYNSIEHLV